MDKQADKPTDMPTMQSDATSENFGGAISRRDLLRTAGAGALLAATGGLSSCARTMAKLGMPGHVAPGDFPKPRFINTNGIRMAIYERGEGLPVVFSHGFPELGYSWRNQIPALANAGFRAIVPDQRGYGLTDRPEGIDQYTIHHLTGDLVGLLDELGLEKAIFVGHDWGGFIAWMMPLLHPERTAGVIGVNTPYMPRAPLPPLQMMESLFGEDFYIIYFQEPGPAEALLGGDTEKTFTRMLRTNAMTQEQMDNLPPEVRNMSFEKLWSTDAPLTGQALVTGKELAYYVKTFERTGFTGGLNWYRNMQSNWETTADLGKKIMVPSLMISAEFDFILRPELANMMDPFVPDLEKHIIADCGHWTQQEKPEQLNSLIIDWLTRRFS